VSAVSFVLFIPWELKHKDPIVDLKLYSYRAFTASSVMMLAVGGILFGTTQLIPQLLQVDYQYSATLSGLALLPGGFAMLVLMPVVGLLGVHVPARYLIAAGMTVTGLSMFHMTSLSGTADFSFYAWARVFQTLGLPSFDHVGLLPRAAAGEKRRGVLPHQCRPQPRRQYRNIRGDGEVTFALDATTPFAIASMCVRNWDIYFRSKCLRFHERSATIYDYRGGLSRQEAHREIRNTYVRGRGSVVVAGFGGRAAICLRGARRRLLISP
jgi:hypothetical protein